MDFLAITHSLVDGLVDDKDNLIIREVPSDRPNVCNILIAGSDEDVRKIIGKKGNVINSIREILIIAAKLSHKHVSVKVESFSDDKEENKEQNSEEIKEEQ